MGRKPTGKPRGRPVGTGVLGEHTRFTVRIPTPLYDRLKAYASGKGMSPEDPHLAESVRQALEHFLGCHSQRQTARDTHPREDNIRQTASVPPGVLGARDLEAMPVEAVPHTPTPAPAPCPTPVVAGPDFERKKYRLGPPGRPCVKAGHLSHGAAGNLKELMSGACVACVVAKKAAQKAAKERTHQPALVAQEPYHGHAC